MTPTPCRHEQANKKRRNRQTLQYPWQHHFSTGEGITQFGKKLADKNQKNIVGDFAARFITDITTDIGISVVSQQLVEPLRF